MMDDPTGAKFAFSVQNQLSSEVQDSKAETTFYLDISNDDHVL